MNDRQRGAAWLWLVLLVLIAVGGWLWWERGTTDMAIVGRATVKAAPDEYVFTPRYETKGADETAIRAQVTETGNGVIAKLRETGVTDAMLTADVSVNPDYSRIMPEPTGTPTGYVATYALTVKLADLELAKKVLDVLRATPVVGTLTPQSTFADATQRKLERDARRLALEDAKEQAQDTAETLGVRLRGLKSVGEPTWGGVPYMGAAEKSVSSAARDAATPATPEFLTGEQEVTYQIQVVYRVR